MGGSQSNPGRNGLGGSATSSKMGVSFATSSKMGVSLSCIRKHMGPWWLLWQRHSLPFGALSHASACLIGLHHKHVEKFLALPLVQVGLTAVCFRSRPQPVSTAAAHYPNHCCCLTHASQNIHYYSSTTATPFFICRSMAIIMILKAAESFVG